MRDFHAKCVKLGKSGGAQKLQNGGVPLGLSVLLAGLKDKGRGVMPKRNRGNEYMCKGETRTVNY